MIIFESGLAYHDKYFLSQKVNFSNIQNIAGNVGTIILIQKQIKENGKEEKTRLSLDLYCKMDANGLG